MMLRSLFSTLAATLVLAAGTTAEAGALYDPVHTTTSVNAYDTDRFRPITFRGGELARVTVDGDGDTDLDLFVYDEDGNLVAKDDDGLDFCVVTFRPFRTGQYTTVVRNLGGVYNRYTLTTN